MAGLLEYTKNGQVTEPPLYRFMRGNVQSFLNSIPDPSKMTPEQQLAMGLNANPIMGLLGTTVYHGSPYAFDNFLADKIGTGLGISRYGKGTYFTESPEVAKAYTTNQGIPLHKLDSLPKGKSGHPEFNSYEEMVNALSEPSGYVYKADIPDKYIPNMMDLTKKFTEQPVNVQQAFKNIAKEEPHLPLNFLMEGNAIGESLLQGIPLSKTNILLPKHGVPGVKYIDKANKLNNKDFYNYVVFDPTEVKILERNNQSLLK